MTAPARPFDDLLGVRSSKGRYYSEYRHSAQDLERTLKAVNAVSWVLADAPRDARPLVDTTLPVIADLVGARALVLVSEHPALGGTRVCLAPGTPPEGADALVRHAESLAADCPPGGLVRAVPALGCAVLVAPFPRRGRGDGWVAAAVPLVSRPDPSDLAIFGTLVNQLAGAVESCQRQQLLQQARHELVSAREAQVRAEERQRIARDLHDSVAQHVLSMGMQVEACRTTSGEPAVVQRLTEVKELARSTVDRIRQAIFELSDGDDLHAHGLAGALRRLADSHDGHGLTVAVRTPRDLPRLPAGVERALYMVAKEALFNTVLHADAERATVTLTVGRDARLVVSDDGCGRSDHLRQCLQRARTVCHDGHHRGLANMAERMRLVQGRLVVRDGRGGGVRIEACAPLSPGAGP